MITAKMLYDAQCQSYDEVIRASYAAVGIPCPRHTTWEALQTPAQKLNLQAYERMAELLNQQITHEGV